jgi:hypothetical protein
MNNTNEIETLTQPLITPEGFVNPACMAELEGAISSMGKTHERLRGDPEWDCAKDQWTFPKDIVGAFAMWACRQSPYGVPNGLESVCKYLNDALATVTEWGTAGMAECSLCDINRWLHEILYEQGVEEFDAWNERKNGRDGMGFSSAFDQPSLDDDFIDLDALLHNVCLEIRDERRQRRAFDAKFEKGEGG